MTQPAEPMSIHRIRLRGPWSFSWLQPPAGLPQSSRAGSLCLPATWTEAFGEAIGTVRLSRTFNRPSGLDRSRVWLDVACPVEASLFLNGAWLARIARGAARFDVTDRLEVHCRLDLELTRDDRADDHQPLVEVALVIESPA